MNIHARHLSAAVVLVVLGMVGRTIAGVPLARAGSFVDTRADRLVAKLAKRADFDALLEQISQVKDAAEWLPQADLDDDARLYLAVRWTQMNFITAAAEALKDIDPELTDTDLLHYYRAAVNLAQGKASEARSDLDALAASYPADPAVLLLESGLLAQQNDLAGAIAVITRILKKDKRHGRAYFQRALLNMLLLLHDQAYEDFTKAAKYLPKQDVGLRQQAYFQAGLVRLRLHGDVTEAQELFQKGIALDPQSELVAELHRTVK
jgi:tetratricopeptide (TPR) repeat protein